jgi:hypothetical protein
MTTLVLTEKEAAFLAEILEAYLSDLKTERVGTDNRAYRSEFIEREKLVSELIGRLQSKT